MTRTLGVIEVRGHSHAMQDAVRLHSLANRRFGGVTLLEWVVRRVTESHFLDDVIVLCEQDPRARGVSSMLPSKVAIYSNKHVDPLERFAAALKKYRADAVVRVCVDTPFVDPVLIERLITSSQAAPDCDYVSYCSPDGRPAILSKVGLFAEWCRADSIFYADRDATSPDDRQEVTRYIYSHPELFQLRLIAAPPRLNRDDLRLSIHGEEDWENAHVIYEALGPESLDWQHIAGLLEQQPALRQRMAILNRADSA